MAGTILVAIKNLNGIGEMSPYVARVAQVGNRVVFLVPCRSDNLGRFQARLAVINGADFSVLASKALAEWCSREAQKNLAERAIAPLRRVLAKKGITVAVHICETSIRKEIRNYGASGEIEIILMSAGMRTKIVSFLDRVKAIGGRSEMPAIRVFATERV